MYCTWTEEGYIELNLTEEEKREFEASRQPQHMIKRSDAEGVYISSETTGMCDRTDMIRAVCDVKRAMLENAGICVRTMSLLDILTLAPPISKEN